MGKFLKTSLFAISLSSLAANLAFADNGSAGRMVIKGKLDGVMTTYSENITGSTTGQAYSGGTAVGSPASYPFSANNSMGNSLGVSLSATYYLTDHLGLEAGTGYFSHKIKATGTGFQYDDPTAPQNTNSNANFRQYTVGKFIPFIGTIKYTIAPYGKLVPYVGVGYHYTFSQGASGSKIGNGRGIVFQAGIDGWIDDNTSMGLEIKQLRMQNKLSYSQAASSGWVSNVMPIAPKMRLNPLFISIGFGYRL